MRKKIYLSIISRLQQLILRDDGSIVFVSQEELQRMKDNNEVINYAIRHFDLWNQNVQFMELEQPSFFPLCFIEFMPIRWEQLSGGVRMANFTIRLHVVNQWLYPTQADSDFQNKGLEYLDLLDMINKALHQFSGDGFGSFSCLNSITNHNHEGIIEDIEEFVTNVKDESARDIPVRIPTPKPTFKLKSQG